MATDNRAKLIDKLQRELDGAKQVINDLVTENYELKQQQRRLLATLNDDSPQYREDRLAA